MKLLAWYCILFVSFNIVMQILSIGRIQQIITPVSAVILIVLSIPVLALGIRIVMKGK